MSDSMLERVAGVIFREFGDRTREVNPADDYKSMKVAALVLSAMREPTGAMVCNAVTFEVTIPDVKAIWAAMIDAALNETDPK